MFNYNNSLSIVLGIMFALLSYMLLDTQYEVNKLKRQAIERNYALYDGKTGKWKWK